MSAAMTGFAPNRNQMRGANAQINREQESCLTWGRM